MNELSLKKSLRIKMKVKKTIIGAITIATMGVGGNVVITQNNINNFQSDLEVMGLQTEQAQHISEYFNGNFLVGKRDTISIEEMQNLVKIYNQTVQEAGGVNLGQIQNPKELTKKLNQEVTKRAKMKKNK